MARVERPFRGDREGALAYARAEFEKQRFTLEDEGGGFRARHNKAYNKNDDPLRLTGDALVRVESGVISVEAAPGAAAKAARLVTIILGLVFGTVMVVQLALGMDPGMVGMSVAVVVLILGVTLVITPNITRVRLNARLQRLVTDMAAAAGDPEAEAAAAHRSMANPALLVAGIVVLAVGIAAFVFGMVHGLGGMKRGAVRVIVPCERPLTLSEPGTYTIFHEYQATVDGRTFSTSDGLTGLTVTMEGPDAPVPLEAVRGTSRYGTPGRRGYSVFRFRIEEPGAYTLKAAYAAGREGPEKVLSIVRWPNGLGPFDGSIFGAVAIALVGGYLIARGGTRRYPDPDVRVV